MFNPLMTLIYYSTVTKKQDFYAYLIKNTHHNNPVLSPNTRHMQTQAFPQTREGLDLIAWPG